MRTSRLPLSLLVLTLIVAPALLAGSAKAAPKPVPTAPEAVATAADETKGDGAKARPVELTVSAFDVAGKSQRFVSSKDLVKVGAAKLVDPAQDLARGLVAVDVQAGTKDGEPVWLRMAMQQGDLKKLASMIKSEDFDKLLLLVGNRVDASCSGPRTCCAKDGEGSCTRMCCGE